MTDDKKLRALIRNDQLDAFMNAEFAELVRNSGGLEEIIIRLCVQTDVTPQSIMNIIKGIHAAGVMSGMLRGAKETSENVTRIINERMGK